MLVEKKKAPLLKVSTVLNKVTPQLVTPSTNSTKSTKAPILGPQCKSSSKLSPPQQNTSTNTNITTQDELEELAVTLCDKLMKAVDTSTPKVYSRNDPKSRISQAILDLIKEKRRLWRLYNNTQDPNIKSTINKLQKEIRTKINQESTISWEKFCNSISLESDPKKSWRKITNFLKLKGPRSYPTLKLGNKTAKTNPEKAQLFAESVERNFGIESHLFSKSQFDRINKFEKLTHTISHH